MSSFVVTGSNFGYLKRTCLIGISWDGIVKILLSSIKSQDMKLIRPRRGDSTVKFP